MRGHHLYLNHHRAVHELARKEPPTGRAYATPSGLLAEGYEFPGQSLAVMVAQLHAGAPRAHTCRTTRA